MLSDAFSPIILAEAVMVSLARALDWESWRTRAESLVLTLTCWQSWPSHPTSLSLPFLLVKWGHLVTFTYLSHTELWQFDKLMKESIQDMIRDLVPGGAHFLRARTT